MELEDLITDDILNANLQNWTNLDTFSKLLAIKTKRLIEGKTKKIHLSLEKIYCEFTDIQKRCGILKNSLLINENCDYKIIVEHLINMIDSNNITMNEENVMNILKLLNVFIEFALSDNEEMRNYFNQLDDVIDMILRRFSKQSTNVIITQFLPNYIQLGTVDECLILTRLARSLNETKRIEILFNLIDNCILSRNNYKLFQILETMNIWEILQDSLVTRDNYQQKQAKYLLLKIIDLFFHEDIPFIKLKQFDDDIVRKSWRNFFIVLDTTNEKQLHLIQPSLNLLKTLKYLHYTWQICLYRNLLKHTQNSIIYFTAISILQQPYHSLFKHVSSDLFNAINLNEYSQISLKFFQELTVFLKRLSDQEIVEILNESLKISWNPTTIWCFYASIFNDATNIPTNIGILENLLMKIQRLPNIFIRNSLIQLILNYAIEHFVPDSDCHRLLKFLTILNKFDNNSLIDALVKFEMNLICYGAEFRKLFLDRNHLSDSNLDVVIRVLERFDMNFLLENLENSDRKFDLFPDNFENDAHNYLEFRLNSCKDDERIDDLLNLIRKYQNRKLFNKAIDILENCQLPNGRILIAFEIIHVNYDESYGNYDRIFAKYHSKIWKNPKLLRVYLNLLLKHCCTSTVVEAHLETFYKILELQYDEIICIFAKYLKNFIRFSNDSEPIQEFIDDLFTKILLIDNNSLFKRTVKVLIDDLITVELINAKILGFVEILTNSPNCNAVITDLMEQLSKVTTRKPELFRNDFSIFIDMMFYGNTINKTEKTEYCVYQDICLKLDIENANPNLDQLLVRLFAIDSLMNLGKFDRKIADNLVVLLLEKYKIKSRKRYFPNSQIHLEKLRIIQVLVLLQPFIGDSSLTLIDFVIDSFLNESHQLSIKYLMQLLLIDLLTDNKDAIKIISDALQKANYTRPTSVSTFIPVLYQLTLNHNESVWEQAIKILLNYTMGPQFRLRLCSQIAIMKLYNSAKDRDFREFVENYQFVYQSVKDIVESSDSDIDEFLDFNFNDIPTTVFYQIPKLSQVAQIEWENFRIIAKNYKFSNIIFNNDIFTDELPQFSIDCYEINADDLKQIDNIQKKITPWRDILIDNHLSDFILVTTLIEKRSNLGGLSRTCEIFRIKQFVLNTTNILNEHEFKCLSMSSENWIDFIEIKLNDLQQFLIDIKTKHYCCIGAEQTADSRQLQQFKFPKLTVLVLGNEREGIPPNLLPYLDYCVEIPQFGVVRSLNVHVAGAIFIWEYCKQHLL